MIDDFLLRALAAGIGVALVAGPIGTFTVWRRMAFFGAALAHSALLGVFGGILLGIDLNIAIIVVAIAIAALLAGLEGQQTLTRDTLLSIVAHGSLALGLVAIAFLETLRVDLLAYLFGDLLAVTAADLVWIYAGGLAALAVLVAIWRPLLALTVHDELARVEGVRAGLVNAVFMLLIAVTVAVAIKIVGLLLIVALLVVPAATARRFARTPEQMAVLASLFGCVSVAGGLGASLVWDTPSGPSVVVVACLLFVLSLLSPQRATV
ncbi:MAG: metal ABC transporter permease [Alphaproteobacteria bacterium]|nr:metal ABC transporter permease [Alphaproteobacteria bacterium]